MTSLEKTLTVRDRRFLLRVETSAACADYQKYEDLREEVWGFPDDHLSSTRNMMCENYFYEGGSLFIGAFVEAEDGGFVADGEHLVGFCYGFVGVRDKEIGYRDPGNLRFYAQFAGVRKAYQSYGLGLRLKEFQREIVRGPLGVSAIICTYDPLTGVNANRNIHHFGMDILEYQVATYGAYGGLLNRADVPTDRFLMSWDLERTGGRPGYDLRAALAAPPVIRAGGRRVAGRTGEIELEVVEGEAPEAAGDVLLVRVPLDFYRMLQETDVDDPDVRRIPVDWRMATRRAFQSLLARGYRAVDFLKAGPDAPANHYVLARGKTPDR
jgi:predicted GNAT superfamily acetyltransferase